MFEELQKKGCIYGFAQKIRNEKLKKAIQNYSLHYFSSDKEIDFNQFPDILQNIKNSTVIIIDQYPKSESYTNTNTEDKHFVICFKKTLMLIKQRNISFIHQLFTMNDKIEFCFLYNTKQSFDKNIKIQYKELKNDDFFYEELYNFNNFFNTELRNFNKHFFTPSEKVSFSKIYDIFCSCLSASFIKESYNKLNINRITNFYSNKDKSTYDSLLKEDEYIELRIIDMGSTSVLMLIYHIEDEQLYIIKKKNYSDDIEFEKLRKREIDNYKIISHPFLPKFRGITKEKHYLVLEFINGKTLLDTDISNYSEIEIFSIIIQILSVIDYLHKNHFIYRDLKPNNIMIDQNKTVVLIDFDRMINEKEINNDKQENDTNDHTNNFALLYAAPEINSGKFTKKSDIYSFGKIVNFIMNEKNIKQPIKYLDFTRLINYCCKEKPNERPRILETFCFFQSICMNNNIILSNVDRIYQSELGELYLSINKINEAIQCYELAANQNYLIAQFNLGNIYYDGEYISRDINKAIHYYSLAANQNNPQAQYNLGVIYSDGEYITQDIDKAIHYYILAANQNLSEAEYNLGNIYYEGKYITRDINKAIRYYSLAADQNHPQAQYNLGVVYHKGNYITQDINKAIHYYSLAANQNIPEAQISLGSIYYEGKYIAQDIDKAIHYYSLAADQNILLAQNWLGIIYSDEKYIARDINKAIHYHLLAAKQNIPESQYCLGNIYYEGRYITRDINKAIYYYSLAAEQNILQAQNNLGFIYYKGKDIEQDINKSIHYYSLAANQNHPEAQYNLGNIYYEGKYINQNIDKAIHYYSLAANQNFPQAQFSLGNIYYEGKYITRDINKAIHYYFLAANQNFQQAQYRLGFIYYHFFKTQKNINLGIFWILESSKRGNIDACFFMGFLYQEGKYIDKDIKNSIHYYKEASSFCNQYAKNNLGIIYKHGIDNEIEKNTSNAEIYFLESIHQKNDRVSMYNLAHLYLFEERSEEYIEKSIDLLISSSNLEFYPSAMLLLFVLLKKYDLHYENVKNDLFKVNENVYNHLFPGIGFNIVKLIDLKENKLVEIYQSFSNTDFLYMQSFKVIETKYLYDFKNYQKSQIINQRKHISQDFYDGFNCE